MWDRRPFIGWVFCLEDISVVCGSNIFVPTHAVLKQRHIEQTATCFLCGAVEETVFHAITECPRAKLCWNEVRHGTVVKIHNLHPLTWATAILDEKICSGGEGCGYNCLELMDVKEQHAPWQKNARHVKEPDGSLLSLHHVVYSAPLHHGNFVGSSQ